MLFVCFMFYLLVCVCVPMEVRIGHCILSLGLCCCVNVYVACMCRCVSLCVCAYMCTNWIRLYVVLFRYSLWERASHWTWSLVGSQQAQRYNCLHFPQSSACGSARVCAIMPGFFMWIPRSEPRASFVQQVFLARVISLTPCNVYLRKQFSQKHFREEWCIYLMSGLLDNI